MIKMEHRHAVAVCAAVTCLTYGLFVFGFLLHNHYLRLPWISDAFAADRKNWLLPLVNWVQYGADVPVFAPIIASILLVFSAYLVASYVTSRLGALQLGLSILVASTFPFNLSIFYYTYASVPFALAHFIPVIAIWCSQRGTLRCHLVATVLFFSSLSVYQPALSVAVTLVVIVTLSEICDFGSSRSSIAMKTRFLRSILPLWLSLFVGVALYAVSTTLGKAHTVTAVKPLTDVFLDLPAVIGISYRHLFLSQPELLGFIKASLLGAYALAVMITLRAGFKKGLMCGLATSLLCASLPLAVKAIFIISPNTDYYTYRYNPGLQYLHLFSFAVIFSTLSQRGKAFSNNIAVAFFCFLVLRLIQADLVYQGLHVRGQQHDLAYVNRILTRIESSPDIDFSKVYRVIFINPIPSVRKDWLASAGTVAKLPGLQHGTHGFPMIWNPEAALQLIGTELKLAPIMPSLWESRKLALDFIEANQIPKWPAKGSVTVLDDLIVVNLP